MWDIESAAKVVRCLNLRFTRRRMSEKIRVFLSLASLDKFHLGFFGIHSGLLLCLMIFLLAIK